MRFVVAMVVSAVLVVSVACGSPTSDPVVRQSAADTDALAGSGPLVVNGCTIEPDTVCQQVDFGGHNLAGVNLSGAMLGSTRGNAYFGNWDGTNLSKANLSGAEVLCVEGTANLAGTDFSGASIIESNLYGSDLRGADFTGAYLANVNFNGADLTGAKLGWASAVGVYMPDGTWVDGIEARTDSCAF